VRRPGRPLGHKLSEQTKQQISESLTETKSVDDGKRIFEELMTMYGDDAECREWLFAHEKDVDGTDANGEVFFMSESRLAGKSLREIPIGLIDSLEHMETISPEFLVLLKERMENEQK